MAEAFHVLTSCKIHTLGFADRSIYFRGTHQNSIGTKRYYQPILRLEFRSGVSSKTTASDYSALYVHVTPALCGVDSRLVRNKSRNPGPETRDQRTLGLNPCSLAVDYSVDPFLVAVDSGPAARDRGAANPETGVRLLRTGLTLNPRP
jgi:hypothetical protein